jgi:hypothetical protein
MAEVPEKPESSPRELDSLPENPMDMIEGQRYFVGPYHYKVRVGNQVIDERLIEGPIGDDWWYGFRTGKSMYVILPFDAVGFWAGASRVFPEDNPFFLEEMDEPDYFMDPEARDWSLDVIKQHWCEESTAFDFDSNLSVFDSGSRPALPAHFTEDQRREANSALDLFRAIKQAARRGDLTETATGHLYTHELARWAETLGEVPPFLIDFLDGHISEYEADVEQPEGQDPECAPYQDSATDDASLGSPSVSHDRVTPTPLMELLQLGRAYWWGGIDPERQYRGNLTRVTKWFMDQAEITKLTAYEMARLIAPQWVKDEGGGGYRNRTRVPLPK